MTNCPDDDMAELLAGIQADPSHALAAIDRQIVAWPHDARLHFLRGSILAGATRPIEAHAAFTRAVALAPDFALARFQLGFFELTSAEPERALATWAPLDAQLEPDHYLAHFVRGLRHLIRDAFADTIAELEAGIAVNGENPPLNNDMQLVIAECRNLVGQGDDVAGEASATSFLLDQFDTGGTRH